MKKNSRKANEQTPSVNAVNSTAEVIRNLKRQELKKLSIEVKPHVQEGTFPTINGAIMELKYRKDGHEKFQTYNQWKEAGFQVKKGEKAFLLWAKPKQLDETEEGKFFPMVYLFSNLQVEPKQHNENSKVEEPPVRFGLSEIEVSYKPSKVLLTPGKIGSSKDAQEIFRSFFENHMEYREAFYVLYLNRANKPLGIYQLSVGGQTGTVVDTKMCLQVALKTHACGIILAHNHPSGNLQPSDADIDLTKKIKNACGYCDINLLDHVILTKESYFSFADEGKI